MRCNMMEPVVAVEVLELMTAVAYIGQVEIEDETADCLKVAVEVLGLMTVVDLKVADGLVAYDELEQKQVQ